MKEDNNLFRDLAHKVNEYLQTRLQILRLQATAVIAKVAGQIIWTIVALFFFFLIIVFGGVTAGFWLSARFESYTLGFATVAGFLIVLFLILFAFRQTFFINPVIRAIIDKTDRKINSQQQTQRHEK